jgi:hypothetical protein
VDCDHQFSQGIVRNVLKFHRSVVEWRCDIDAYNAEEDGVAHTAHDKWNSQTEGDLYIEVLL